MKREITLKQVGYRITGTATLNLWGGGQGSIDIKPSILAELTTEGVIKSINDNGFGCESFAGANVDISVLYEGGVGEYMTTVEFTEEDLRGSTNVNVNFKALAENYEKSHEPIVDKGEGVVEEICKG